MTSPARIWIGLLALASGCATARYDASSAAGAARASNQFGADLYPRLNREEVNLICSPASASIALSMASAGAAGRTLSEMAAVLHLDPANLPGSYASFGDMLVALNGRDGAEGVALRVADRLWGQSDFALKAPFLALLRDRFKAPLETLDFENETEKARAAINAWAAEQTHDLIREVLSPGVLTGQTRLVLVNAVYFKGKWVRPFEPEQTTPRPFKTANDVVQVPTMAQLASFSYARAGSLQILELPYRGGLSMIVVLPDARDGLADAERRLGDYDDWIKALRPALVDLELPRWKLESRLALVGPLAELGMRAAFSSAEADLSAAADAPLVIDAVIQAAFIEVDEAGTTAAAVTVVGAQEVCAHDGPTPKPIVFHADHPFLFLIRDQQTGVVLFVGRVGDPRG